MRKTHKILLFCLFTLILFIYFSLYFITPSFVVKNDIQNFFDKEYDRKFKIVNIKTNYSPDFLHQANGYEIELEDGRKLKFGNIFVQKNSVKNKWTLYQGSDVEVEYLKAEYGKNK